MQDIYSGQYLPANIVSAWAAISSMSGTRAVKKHSEQLYFVLIHIHVHSLEHTFYLNTENYSMVPLNQA